MEQEHLLLAVLSVLVLPMILILFTVIVLASLGKSLGVRKRYVKLLLKIFQFGKVKIELHEKKQHPDEEDSDLEDTVRLCEDKASHLIERDIALSATAGIKIPDVETISESLKHEFHLTDIMYFTKCGVEAIIEDDVTSRFTAEELQSWNLLTRNNDGYHFISVRLTILYFVGLIIRYCMLFPFRLVLAVIGTCWLIVTTAIIGYLPNSLFKKLLNQYVSLMSHRILSRAFSATIIYHNRENRAKNGICVANHTSPIDVIILSCDNCYSMVGQAQGGFMGIMQRAMARANAHIWFERSESKDREAVARRLKEHVDNENKLPILIFPEGTCINNTSVMMFKKGSFEVGRTIYPVAIKYDSRFGDAFWNSSKANLLRHLSDIMSSWALVCDVWYLPSMTKMDGEDAVSFANRVKAEIARKGGLVDLEWDGQLKRTQAKESLRRKPQEQYSKTIKID
ncbi:glycerol-3-phosphate acyltransferase 3 [Octopus bimaculoides]|uniref:Phospholipid/glycerol acyltransferase domain-containing protein n=1 Tax=Octopus bimaculoides TaxID=37653 RepID=A0A0L8GKX9_OCTBM|nr:glycerol-3-phosphate acyltransferase 3 [Octopus bimaculoides]|eukprot:XP_014780392.1 PREDICTED: glycerol-3-phosphate acyltransferase 3-like [Octopus bimaculoides]